MANKFPVVPESTFVERQGVHYLGWIASQTDLIWREVPNTDLGIDGYLEVVVNGAPIGLIAVQVKSGSSYIESPNENSFIFRAKRKHVRYWLSYRLPVIVVVYDPESKVAYWHYIQEVVTENDEEPSTESVPIHISKSMLFNEAAQERLIEIAATPDSTAHAMLALRASRYKYTHELLSRVEMIELYGQRKWLGAELLPLDKDREQILMHSTLIGRGPSWFWFRTETKRAYVPYLKTALKHPNPRLRGEAAFVLAAAVGPESVSNLRELLNTGEYIDVFYAAKALAFISSLTPDERKQIVKDYSAHSHQFESNIPRRNSFDLLSLIAKIGGIENRERIINYYFQFTGDYPISYSQAPQLLKTAGYLWSEDELPQLRKLLEENHGGMQALAVVALSKLGERRDLNPIVEYIKTPQWLGHEEDRQWLAQQVARLFNAQDLEWLRHLLSEGYDSEWIAHPALSNLCRRLDKETLVGMLEDSMTTFQEYGIRGLIAIGEAESLTRYEHLLNSENFLHSKTIAMGLTASGNWDVIDRLMQSDVYGMPEAIAEGLRYITKENDKGRVFDYLFELLQDDDARLKAGESLALVGDEDILHKIVEWLIKHPYESSADVLTDTLIHLDHRLYCPIQWSMNMERDFSFRRYSATRFEENNLF